MHYLSLLVIVICSAFRGNAMEIHALPDNRDTGKIIQSADSFTVIGHVDYKDGDTILLKPYREENGIDIPPTVLKTIVKNGRFKFSGSEKWPRNTQVIHQDTLTDIIDRINIYIENNSTIFISGDSLKNAKVTGGPTQKDWEEFLQIGFGKDYGKNIDAYFKKHSNSYVCFDILLKSFILGPYESVARGKYYFDSVMDRSLVNSELGTIFNKKIATRIAMTEKGRIGKMAPNFSQPDVNGKLVRLASLKGSYVFLDFWASWCGPCRAENPHVKKVYDKFKNKNIQFLNVSLDTDAKAWLTAVKKDNLPWKQVSDLKGYNNEVALLYGVSWIPQNFLIDPDGKIIAKNLFGDELSQKLGEIFPVR